MTINVTEINASINTRCNLHVWNSIGIWTTAKVCLLKIFSVYCPLYSVYAEIKNVHMNIACYKTLKMENHVK